MHSMNEATLDNYLNFAWKGTALHGNTPFDTTLATRITDTLYQGGTPSYIGNVPADFKYVLNLYPWESYRVPAGTTVREVDLLDDDLDNYEQVYELAHWVNEKQKEGKVLVHCQAGLNRSALVTALSLMLQGMSADEAITLLRTKRDAAVLCNPYFEKWLREVGHD